MIKVGNIYKHYKGNAYCVIALAKHSETMEDMVVYQDLSDEAKIWARPKKIFSDLLENGSPRFVLLVSYSDV